MSARYLRRFVRSQASPVAKADAAQTFSFTPLTPALVVGFSLPLLDFFNAAGVLSPGEPLTAYVPYSRILWTVLGLFPVFAAACVFYTDYRDDYHHHPYEYVAALTLGFYLIVNTAVYVVAFIEEFVLCRPHVFVVTTRADDDLGD